MSTRSSIKAAPPEAALRDQLISLYFVAQAVVGIGLWALAGASPAVRSWFELLPDQPAVVDAFLYPDIVVIVVASLASAWATHQRASWQVPMAAFTAGAVVYPTVWILGWLAVGNGTGGAALAIMLPPATLSCVAAVAVWRENR